MKNIGSNNRITLGLSSCPNDTFIFYALLHNKVPLQYKISPLMADVEELNQRVLARSIDVSKVSFHVLGHVLDDYMLLRSGSAMGRGCGPLLLARTPLDPHNFERYRIAIPGKYTTAALLLKLFAPGVKELVPMNFALIAQAVAGGEVDGGIIIHETRFTYHDLGLICIQDLGTWWEKKTGFPIPLGGIIAKRSLGIELLQAIDAALGMSIKSAFKDPDAVWDFVMEHAQEMSYEVMRKHIDLYVNQYTLDLGEEGIKAVEFLLEQGQKKGHFPLGPAWTYKKHWKALKSGLSVHGSGLKS
ncbi:MAG: 1,4-dihydroxy-6-naphthoate synthase [Deltaproteobacteria bacterium]|nr:MAG: 1,4-dihydroxy-6-naphthoate synthase [Deltaproteobacteria bacterium]